MTGKNLMKRITAKEVQNSMSEQADFTIIDVREPEEVAEGIIPGALHIPLGELEDRYEELDKTERYVIVCRSGNRSGVVTKFLNSLDYDATNMIGGMLVWSGDVVTENITENMEGNQMNEGVTVYTTTQCPYCVMVKNFLTENKIDFTEVNVETNPAIMNDLVKKTGQMGVPQTEVNGNWVVGFDPNSIMEALRQ